MVSIEELAELGRRVDPVIERYVEKAGEFRSLLLYQLKLGGKRLRPAVTMLSCEASGGRAEDALVTAALLELVHNYTLVLDDIIDRADLRRGKPTVRKRYGDNIAILIGMYYREIIEDMVLSTPSPVEVSKVVSDTIKMIADGERLDILFEQAGRSDPYVLENRYHSVSLRDYIDMVSKKTAALFAACCKLGAMMAKADTSTVEKLTRYGWELGVVFQIADDIIDLFSTKSGKQLGKDIIEHKLGNVCILVGLEALDAEGRQLVLEKLRKERVVQEDIKQVISLLEKAGAREKALELGRKHVEAARESLAEIPDSRAKRTLLEIPQLALERTY